MPVHDDFDTMRQAQTGVSAARAEYALEGAGVRLEQRAEAIAYDGALPIGAAMAELDQALERLDDRLDLLAGRLVDLLAPERPMLAVDSAEKGPSHAPHVDAIFGRAGRVYRASARLESLLERLAT